MEQRIKIAIPLFIRFVKYAKTIACIEANVHALAYAALCQEASIVPIIEPEVLMEGDHTLQKCFDVTVESAITFLSGGQSPEDASAISTQYIQIMETVCHEVSFSFARAIQ